MNSDPILRAALTDLRRLMAWCSAHPASPIPEEAVSYLAANAEALAFLISGVYDGTTTAERSEIHAGNNTLDYSAIDDAARGLAESTLTQAIQWVAGNRLSPLTDQDILMLLRALEYAQYVDARSCPIELEGSPLLLR